MSLDFCLDIAELPEDLKVGSFIYLKNTKINKIPNHLKEKIKYINLNVTTE